MAGENVVEIVVTLRSQVSQGAEAVRTSLKRLGDTATDASTRMDQLGGSLKKSEVATRATGIEVSHLSPIFRGAARDVGEWSLILGSDLSPALQSVTATALRAGRNILELGTTAGLVTGIVGILAAGFTAFISKMNAADQAAKEFGATLQSVNLEATSKLVDKLSQARTEAIESDRAWRIFTFGLINNKKEVDTLTEKIVKLNTAFELLRSERAPMGPVVRFIVAQNELADLEKMGAALSVIATQQEKIRDAQVEFVSNLPRALVLTRAQAAQSLDQEENERTSHVNMLQMAEDFANSREEIARNITLIELREGKTREQILEEALAAQKGDLEDNEKTTTESFQRIRESWVTIMGDIRQGEQKAWVENNRIIADSANSAMQSVNQSVGGVLEDLATGKLRSFADIWTETWQSLARIAAQTTSQFLLFGLGGAPAPGKAPGGGLLGLLSGLLGGGGGTAEIFAPFQRGGIVRKPTLGMVGEAGPEAIVPLDEAGALGGGTTVINLFRQEDLAAVVAQETAKNRNVVVNDVLQGMRGNGPIRRAVQRGG